MKIIDIDILFEKFIRDYMLKNAGKFTEDEWEDKVPELYTQFGSQPLKELGGKSPVDYYAELSPKELCQLLSRHVEEEVPVSDYLCEALVSADTEDGLMAFLKEGTDEELTSYAINVLQDKACLRPLPIYIKYVIDPKTDDNMRELMGEVVIENAPAVKDELLSVCRKAKAGKMLIAEALSNCPKEQAIYDFLIEEFLKTKELSLYAHFLVKYGDERAVEHLKTRIADPVIKYADYAELKYAIEALGGEYEDNRDFTADKTYRKIKSKKN